MLTEMILSSRSSHSWTPGRRHLRCRGSLNINFPWPLKCSLPKKGPTTVGSVLLSKDLSFSVYSLALASFSPSFTCPIKDGQEMAKQLKANQIILEKLLTDLAWDFPGKNTGVGCYSKGLPDPGIFKGSPGDLSDPGIQPIIPALAGGLFTAGLPGNPRHFSTYSRFIGT